MADDRCRPQAHVHSLPINARYILEQRTWRGHPGMSLVTRFAERLERNRFRLNRLQL